MAVADAVRSLFRGGGGTDELLSKERQDFVRACAAMPKERADRYRLFSDIYDQMIHPPLDARQRQYLQACGGIPFGENFCRPVIDKLARRLTVEALRVDGNAQAEKWLNETVWARNRMDGLQKIVHTEVPKKGDGYLLVAWDNGLQVPTIRWKRPELCNPCYDDDTGDLLHVSILWPTSTRSASNPSGRLIMRLNIYLPDRVEKWYCLTAATEDADWAPYYDVEGEQWPTPWTRSQTVPADGTADAEDALGVSVIHFRNRAGDGWFGRSDLHDAVPFKQELDKWLLDLFDVMDVQGAKQRWGSGVESTGALNVPRGSWVTSDDPNARFGELSAEDPAPILSVIEATLRRMSVVCATPFQDLWSGGQPPTGESLKTSMFGLTERALDWTIPGGNSWEDTAAACWRVGDAFGNDVPQFDPAAMISCEWDSVETRDDVADAAKYESLIRQGLSKRTALREQGYDPDEEEAQRVKEAEASAAAQAKAFDQAGAFGGGA